MEQITKNKKCNVCNDSGIRLDNKYFGCMKVCECNQVERLPNGGLRIDMNKTPGWFQRNYKNFLLSMNEEQQDEDE